MAERGARAPCFTYGQAGIPLTMRYQGQTYYCRTNERGDVVALTDAQGNVVASYRYDAWGNIVEATGPLAQVNPYRYAGYRWDGSTGLLVAGSSRDHALGLPPGNMSYPKLAAAVARVRAG